MNREAWLSTAADLLRPVFEAAGYTVPAVKISCSWPGGGAPSKRAGECWPRSYSAAGVNEIFISPAIADPIAALAVLVHEMVHAVDDCVSGHKKAFARAAKAVGLVGKPTTTQAGPDLLLRFAVVIARLGEYPHAKVSLADRKKQSTRMVKVECSDCGGVFRTTRKWLDAADHLTCPFCQSDAVKVEEGDAE
jgi:Zn finger protein HypA/HybF involved in hydrogenase expression